ncbi:unnamed protein product [Rhodiola kirilowii]
MLPLKPGSRPEVRSLNHLPSLGLLHRSSFLRRNSARSKPACFAVTSPSRFVDSSI